MTLAPAGRRRPPAHRARRARRPARHPRPGRVLPAPAGRDLAEVQARHDAPRRPDARSPRRSRRDWRRGSVERADLARFLFEPEDIVVVVGQDGLVANVAKYLDGQPVIGVDPEPGRNPGVLVTTRRRPRSPACCHAWTPARRRSSRHGRGRDRRRPATPRSTRSTSATRPTRPRATGSTPPGAEPRAAVVVRAHRRHRHRRHRLVPLAVAGAATATLALPGADRPRAGLVRPRGLAVAGAPGPCTPRACSTGDELEVVVGATLVVFGDGIEADALALTWGQTVTLAELRGRYDWSAESRVHCDSPVPCLCGVPMGSLRIRTVVSPSTTMAPSSRSA